MPEMFLHRITRLHFRSTLLFKIPDPSVRRSHLISPSLTFRGHLGRSAIIHATGCLFSCHDQAIERKLYLTFSITAPSRAQNQTWLTVFLGHALRACSVQDYLLIFFSEVKPNAILPVREAMSHMLDEPEWVYED